MRTILFSCLLLCCLNVFAYHDPNTGRFLSRDPIGEDGGENLYAIVSNNAVNWSDDLGLKIKSVKFSYEKPTQSWYEWSTSWYADTGQPGDYHGSVERYDLTGNRTYDVKTDLDDIGLYFNKTPNLSSMISTNVFSGTNTGAAYQLAGLTQLTGKPNVTRLQHSSYLDGKVEITGCCYEGYATVAFVSYAFMISNVKTQQKGDGTGANAFFTSGGTEFASARINGHVNETAMGTEIKLESFPPPNDTTVSYNFRITVDLNTYSMNDKEMGMGWLSVTANCLGE